MFSSSFTMSEQEHRQWTPYKHCRESPSSALFPASSHSEPSCLRKGFKIGSANHVRFAESQQPV
jgi:hypothetical protein